MMSIRSKLTDRIPETAVMSGIEPLSTFMIIPPAPAATVADINNVRSPIPLVLIFSGSWPDAKFGAIAPRYI